MGSTFVDGKEWEVDEVKNAENKIKKIYIPLGLSDFYKPSIIENSISQDLITKISAKLIDNQSEIIEFHASLLREK